MKVGIKSEHGVAGLTSAGFPVRGVWLKVVLARYRMVNNSLISKLALNF